MARKIELYIHSKQHTQMDTQPLDHIKEMRQRRSVGGYNEKLVTSVNVWLPENEAKVKEMVEEFTIKHDMILKVYDLADFWHGVKANIKGITTSPTVILGSHRLTSDITLEKLKEAL